MYLVLQVVWLSNLDECKATKEGKIAKSETRPIDFEFRINKIKIANVFRLF